MSILTLVSIVGVFGLIISGLLIYLAYTPTNTGEVQVVVRFKKFLRALRPGFGLIWPILDKVAEVISTRNRHEEFPAEPEKVVQSDTQPIVGDEKRPFRIQQKGMTEALYLVKKAGYTLKTDEDPLEAYDKIPFNKLPKRVQKAMKSDPAHAPLTTVVPAIVDWYVKSDDESVENFVSNIDKTDGSRDNEVRRRLADDTEVAIRELLGQFTAGHTVDMLEVLNASFQWKMEVAVGEKPRPGLGLIDKPWGIHIASASLKAGDLGETVNRARAAAGAAVSARETKILDSEADAIAVRNAADAEAHKTRVLGEANAAKILAEKKAEGKGEAAQVKAMAESLTKPGGLEARRLQVAETVMSVSGRTVFVPSHVGEIASVLGLASDLATGSKTPPTAPPADNTATTP